MLHRVRLLTGEQSLTEVPSYEFRIGSRWSELPGGSLLITGGYMPVREVVRLETLREYAVCSQPPMHTARHHHAALYHSQYVYVLAGRNNSFLSECERYVCTESRWEVLPAMPVGAIEVSAVELDNSLYALGGRNPSRMFDTVQKLSLNSLTWQLMELKLPQVGFNFPLFKSESQVYVAIMNTLYCFTPLEIKPIKILSKSIACFSSYYSRGTLYYELRESIESLDVGELTSLE
jgi:hypothetical protein